MTAMMLLTANSMDDPQHDDMLSDKRLVEDGLQLLEQMVKETRSEALQSFQTTCTELHQYVQRKSGQPVFAG